VWEGEEFMGKILEVDEEVGETEEEENQPTPVPVPTPSLISSNIYTNEHIPGLRIDYTGWSIKQNQSPNDSAVSLKKDSSALKVFVTRNGKLASLSYTSTSDEFNGRDIHTISEDTIRVKNWNTRYNVDTTAWQYTGNFYQTNALERCGREGATPNKLCVHP